MNKEQAERLIRELDSNARVVDVGGGAMPFPRADYVIDALPYDKRASLGELDVSYKPRFTQDTWCQVDLCERRPWPFPDKFFDFATCSHLLEDIRDPIWVCSELCRVAKAGYIEVPSRIVEQSLGVEHPNYAGYYHHRWLVDATPEGLIFRHKPHMLHVIRDSIVASLGVSRLLNPKHSILTFEWSGGFRYVEKLEFDEDAMIEELCAFAFQARGLPDLTISNGYSLAKRAKRLVHFRRLRTGGNGRAARSKTRDSAG